MSVPGAKVPTARILVVGVCGIGVLNCGFSPSVCSATVTSLFKRGAARRTACHEGQRIANAAAIFLTSANLLVRNHSGRFGVEGESLIFQQPASHRLCAR